MTKKIVIIGGGFGGVYVARRLLRCGYSIQLINDDDYFTFTPLLHEAATGTLSETDVRFRLDSFLPKSRLRVISSLATQVNFETRTISLANGQELSYDILIIASGARTNTGLVEGCENALCLKSMADVISIKKRIAQMISAQKPPLRVNVIGAGFTGLELICELAQLARLKMGCACELRLFDRGPLPLASADPEISAYVAGHLKKLGISFHENFIVSKIDKTGVHGEKDFYPSDLTILTLGVIPNTEFVPSSYRDERNNIIVSPELHVPQYSNVFALGDIITIKNEGKPPMLAQLAVQEATTVATNVMRLINGQSLKKYQVKLKGTLISLGTWNAAGRIFGWAIYGRIAWYIWRTVYLFKTPGWKNKLRIAWRWTVYLFKKRQYISAFKD